MTPSFIFPHKKFFKFGSQASPVINFFSHFINILIPLYIITSITQIWKVPVQIFLKMLAAICLFVSQLIGIQNVCRLDNFLLHSETGCYVHIDQSCSGLPMMFVILTGLWVYGSRKFHHYLIAVCVVQGLNVLRIVHLFYLVNIDFERFQLFHIYIWQGVNFIGAVSLFSFLLWNSNAKSKLPN